MGGNGLGERETASGSLFRRGKLRGEVHQHSMAHSYLHRDPKSFPVGCNGVKVNISMPTDLLSQSPSVGPLGGAQSFPGPPAEEQFRTWRGSEMFFAYTSIL